ncbi:family 20 glycosylhydrolase [Chitinophagaceae bacterium LB-8]|uniref:beta-N-acetylhexosaminidase n=1 Tax=Paraflavisolibacter caeni TaxID=2982496 RepID=A0A9X2XP16_9BACT|nr:family 20 glycosylhydrolase [Paraflavisolibacter caeni]MCU7550198.1 family 20 glycosylhydrolase [Paraflavisolibacter caeni]
MRLIYSLVFVLFTAPLCFSQSLNIIPQPASIIKGSGSFELNRQTALVVPDEEDRKAAQFFNDYLKEYYGFKLGLANKAQKNSIRLTTRKFIKAPEKDAYQLTVNSQGVSIEGDTYPGTFYGIQSLIQLLPVPKTQSQATDSKFVIPHLTIQDTPRFAYRGLHLDVGRHMYPVSFIKKYIDYIALHKMNYFHWHLTEDQGWRIEIKKYPGLTKVGAWRDGTIIGRYPGTGNDNTRYGGYYSQEEVKEIVQYAADRHITVIPEIEMPGHSSAALTAYPWLGCPGSGPYKVEQTWGVFDDIYCAGKDSTFQFLQDVLDEVISLFPSKYIHIGGDESPKTNWKACPLCQARIKAEGLKDEHELQSYFIHRMEKYVNSKGRTIIGWDEILEGGLAPKAVVMSWRGESGGIAAAKENHYVIMTPGSHCYFDYSQAQNEDSVTIGGYIPLEKVYSYEPVPNVLDKDQAKYILGAQANVWTEYMRYPSKVEYMIFPRLSAISEVLWTAAAKKNWSDFERRMQTQYLRYQLWKTNYSNAYFDIKTALLPAPGNKGVLVKFESKDKTGKLMYRIAGKSAAKNYTTPFVINATSHITGIYYKNGKLLDSVTIPLQFNKATGKKVTLNEPPSKNYPGDGAFTLTDGIINDKGLNRSREFIGYNGNDISATIDLGTAQKIDTIVVHSLYSAGSWIYPPQSIDVSISTDGKSFKKAGSSDAFIKMNGGNGKLMVTILPTSARYIQVDIKNLGKIPEGKAGAGEKAWLFLDEIEIL